MNMEDVLDYTNHMARIDDNSKSYKVNYFENEFKDVIKRYNVD